MLRTWFIFERSCHLPHHLSLSHFVYTMKNECNIHFPHNDIYTSWKDSILLSSSHFCWKNNDWTWDCAVITRLRPERKIKASTSHMAQQDDETTINDLQFAKCSSLFLCQSAKQQFPPSKNSYPATELFPMHAVVTEDHKVSFWTSASYTITSFPCWVKAHFPTKGFRVKGKGGRVRSKNPKLVLVFFL